MKVKFILFNLVLLLIFSCKTKLDDNKTVLNSNEKKVENWISLFNGKNLEGWIPKIRGYEYGDNVYNTFRVEDGVIKVSYDEYEGEFKDKFGHLFYKTPYSNYRLKLQYRFVGSQIKDGPSWAAKNSGVMVHCEDPKMMGKNQKFPLSIEVQLLGGVEEGISRPTGNLCTPGTNVILDGDLVTTHCTNSSSDTYYVDQWINLEVEVYNDSLIIHKINNKEVLRYSKPQIGGADLDDYNNEYKNRIGEPIKSGYLSLQSESHPVEFKNIELLKL